jgi:membrane-associated protease RseP (regulator of RpoE activity)
MGSELLPFTTSDTFRQVSFSDLNSLVRKYFNVQQGFIDSVHGGVPTFVILKDQNLKASFGKLNSRLDAYSLVPILREGEEKTQCILRVFSLKKDLEGEAKKKRRISVQVILLLATIVTVTISGVLIAQEFFGEINQVASLSLLLLVGGEYAASLMAILVVHELGHVIATKLHLIKSSLPYFVPAPPILGPGLTTPGTFGAVILQNTSAINRDQLFDLGIAGPLSGFIVAIIVTFMGISLSVPIAATASGGTLPPPLFYIIIALYPAGTFPPGSAIALHPVALAGYIGLIITCLNLFPVSQLDGGHTSRAAFGASGYAKASVISIAALLVLGLLSPTIFLPFALLVIFFSFLGGGGHPGPLDDVSRITRGRKILFIIGFIVLILSLPMDYLRILQYLP